MHSVNSAAEILGVSPGRVYQLITDKKLPAKKFRGSPLWLIKEADLEKLKEERTNQAEKADL